VEGHGGVEAIKYQETKGTNTCLKLIPPTHNHETHARPKKQEKRKKNNTSTLSQKHYHEP
jgi:hypothetical protein